MQKYHSSGYNNRIFLFSDGLVNEGIQNKSEIAKLVRDDIKTERDVKVSAFGLGEDFDEEVLILQYNNNIFASQTTADTL